MRGSMAALAVIGFIATSTVLAADAPPAPVLEDLGTVYPTPHPTGKPFDKKRLVTMLTVRNAAEGETVVVFEASDVAKDEKGDFKSLASKQYVVTEAPPKMKARKIQILEHLRELEKELLEYAEIAGPPKELVPATSGSHRPYED